MLAASSAAWRPNGVDVTTDLNAYSFGPLHCSLGPKLGDYYQDMTGAIDLVESGYHGGLDEGGVAVTRYGAQGLFYNATTTAQYTIALHGAILAGAGDRTERLRVQLDSLIEHQQHDGSYAGCWMMSHDNPKYPWLVAPWTSALASGNAISALLRGWELLGDERYRRAAELGYMGMHEPATKLTLQTSEQLWYEEYPAQEPLHVLNGHVYALLGVLDYARVTADVEAERRWQRGAATLLNHLERFDLGFWSCYDLRFREPVSLHYQKNIHVPQLQILAALTGEARFSEMAQRWQGYADSRIARARWQVSLRTRRWRRGNHSSKSASSA